MCTSRTDLSDQLLRQNGPLESVVYRLILSIITTRTMLYVHRELFIFIEITDARPSYMYNQ